MAQVRLNRKNSIKKQISANNLADILYKSRNTKFFQIIVLGKYFFKDLISYQIGRFYPIHPQSP